ncbi:ThiF family adenylyltransferase [Pedobacter faecalis]|uniref:ThiF family adenylyltransferase n=1 Tax=Pedobacter faecalis TaxID=3041495 RepID=UPI00254C1D3E|nr:ThiF family adenylyltransferase [Pedobacter sp. ELA7]
MKEEWYSERNKRTDSFTETNPDCHNVKIKVIVTLNTSEYVTQVMLTVLVNILARWCHTIQIICDDSSSIITPSKSGTILNNLREMLTGIDPHGEFYFNGQPAFEEDILISIGSPGSNTKSPFVAIDANGWVASCAFNNYAGCDSPIKDTKNPLGAAFAACLGNAELFRWANNISSGNYCQWYDLYSMSVEDKVIANPELLTDLDLGRVHVLGCGAIGSSFAYLMGLVDFSGEILFIDADAGVEIHNTSSSLLFAATDCDGRTKTEICKSYLLDSKYVVETFDGDYKNFNYNHHSKTQSADVIMCFANDFDIWSTVQNLYPPLVFHATTSRSWGINVGRHIPLKDNCIMCTFKDLARVVFVPKCAEVDLPQRPIKEGSGNDEPHASILPFLSPSAAIIAFSQLIKLNQGKVVEENSTQFNMSSSGGIFIEDQQKSLNCDICRSQIPSLYNNLNIRLAY